MSIKHHSSFNGERINAMLAHYHQKLINGNLPKSIVSYEDFCAKIPILRDVDLNHMVDQLHRSQLLSGCTFTISSATSGKYKLLAQRVGRVITPTNDNYPYQLVMTLAKLNVFSATDVVANLLSAGGMSLLFDGGNRLLEMINASVLPIGRLDAHLNALSTYLKFMVDLNVNTLFGTPSSIMQCANALTDAKFKLNIEKVVFVGETFTEVKRHYTRQFFPNMNVYGLYGQSETGIVGVHTPYCHSDCYHVLEDFFFVEITTHGEILITDLTTPFIPLFRYYVGDIGELITDTCACKHHLPILKLRGRCDKKFNYMGNLISYEKIKNIISTHYGKNIDVQIQLSTDQCGNDLLNVIIDDHEAQINIIKDDVIDMLCRIEEVNEGIKKGVGVIEIGSRDRFYISNRQKIPLIHDTRLKRTDHSVLMT